MRLCVLATSSALACTTPPPQPATPPIAANRPEIAAAPEVGPSPEQPIDSGEKHDPARMTPVEVGGLVVSEVFVLDGAQLATDGRRLVRIDRPTKRNVSIGLPAPGATGSGIEAVAGRWPHSAWLAHLEMPANKAAPAMSRLYRWTETSWQPTRVFDRRGARVSVLLARERHPSVALRSAYPPEKLASTPPTLLPLSARVRRTATVEIFARWSGDAAPTGEVFIGGGRRTAPESPYQPLVQRFDALLRSSTVDTLPLEGHQQGRIAAVCAASPSDVLAVGTVESVAVGHDVPARWQFDGAKWDLGVLPAGAPPWGVACSRDSEVWIGDGATLRRFGKTEQLASLSIPRALLPERFWVAGPRTLWLWGRSRTNQHATLLRIEEAKTGLGPALGPSR